MCGSRGAFPSFRRRDAGDLHAGLEDAWLPACSYVIMSLIFPESSLELLQSMPGAQFAAGKIALRTI